MSGLIFGIKGFGIYERCCGHDTSSGTSLEANVPIPSQGGAAVAGAEFRPGNGAGYTQPPTSVNGGPTVADAEIRPGHGAGSWSIEMHALKFGLVDEETQIAIAMAMSEEDSLPQASFGAPLYAAQQETNGLIGVDETDNNRYEATIKIVNVTDLQKMNFSIHKSDLIPVFTTVIPNSNKDITFKSIREDFDLVPVAIESETGWIEFSVPIDTKLDTTGMTTLWFGMGGKPRGDPDLQGIPKRHVPKGISKAAIDGLRRFLGVEDVKGISGVRIGQLPVCSICPLNLPTPAKRPATIIPEELSARGITICAVGTKEGAITDFYPKEEIAGNATFFLPATSTEPFLAYLKDHQGPYLT